MNTMIKIALFDENRYFSAGWQEALALHFSTYGKRTLLLDAQQVHEADLVFCYFPPGVQSCFCHLSEAQPAGRKTLYFSLRTPEGRHKRTVGNRCSLETGVIYHDMPLVSALYQVSAELEILGLDASRHVMDFYAPMLEALGVTRSADLLSVRSGAQILAAGVKVATQTPPIRSGRRVVFLTVDDATGPVDATFFEDVQGPYAATIFHSWLLLVRGTIRRAGPRGVSVLASGAWELSTLWEA